MLLGAISQKEEARMGEYNGSGIFFVLFVLQLISVVVVTVVRYQGLLRSQSWIMVLKIENVSFVTIKCYSRKRD